MEWAKHELKNMAIKDTRIINRAIKVTESIYNNMESSTTQSVNKQKDIKAMYRLYDNEKFSSDLVLNSHRKNTIARMNGEDVILVPQDTTEINYDKLTATEGLGPHGGMEKSAGLIMHSSIAVTTEGVPLGILDMDIWSRKYEKRGDSKNSRKKPIEMKESNKWLKSLRANTEGIPDKTKVINICDREGDFFEFMHIAMQEEKHFIVRVKGDRVLEFDEKLFDVIKNKNPDGQIRVSIPRDSRKKIPERESVLNIKYLQVNIPIPEYLKARYGKDVVLKLNLVCAEEIDPPKGEKAISWNLFTNVEVDTIEDAEKIIKYYKQRWKIERFHYVLKSGLNVEDYQFEKAERIKKAIALSLICAWRILFILYVSRENPDAPCNIVFLEDEWKTIYCISKEEKFPCEKPPSIKETVLMLAKLGGFLGRKGDGDPGVKVLWRGINKLTTVLKYKDFTINVITVGNV